MNEDTEIKQTTEKDSFEDEKVVYELGYHITPSVSEEAVDGEVQNIKKSIEKDGGVFISEEAPVSMRLAYTFTRTTNGKTEKYDMTHFGSVKFEAPLGVIVKIKEALDLNKNILRFLIIKTVREETRVSKSVISTIQQPKEGNDKVSTPIIVKKPIKRPEPTLDKDLDRTIENLVVE